MSVAGVLHVARADDGRGQPLLLPPHLGLPRPAGRNLQSCCKIIASPVMPCCILIMEKPNHLILIPSSVVNIVLEVMYNDLFSFSVHDCSVEFVVHLLSYVCDQLMIVLVLLGVFIFLCSFTVV